MRLSTQFFNRNVNLKFLNENSIINFIKIVQWPIDLKTLVQKDKK